jgi:hypothetical protein
MQSVREYRRWTPAEEAYLRQNYEKLTRAEIAKALGRTYRSIEGKVREMGLINSPFAYKGVPMEAALPPEGVELVRTAFRALVTVRNRYGKVDVSKFLQAWRERECGFRHGNNINRRVTAR